MFENTDYKLDPEWHAAFRIRVRGRIDRFSRQEKVLTLLVQLITKIRIDGYDGQLRFQITVH